MIVVSRIRGVGFVVGLLATLCSGNASWAQIAADRIHVDIPAQGLSNALTQFGRETSTEIVFTPESVERKTSTGIRGDFTREKAIFLLLGGTGLTYRITSQGAIVIESSSLSEKHKESTSSAQETPSQTRLAQESGSGPETSQNGISPAGAEQMIANRSNLNEIVVTAQKRNERIQDVPLPVTVLSAQTLVENNQLRLQDYYTQVPGFSVAPGISSSYQLLSIRGITTGSGTNPTVGVTIDDAPIGSSTFLGGGAYVPDIDPSDLARVEVLRGPQGTLYGASSLGGLLKFVTVDPSTDALRGAIQAGTSTAYNGAEMGYNFRASVNLPISDSFAIRASAFTHQDPGYIDNPVLHIDGINEEHVSGGRLSALWRPSDAFSLKLSALYQDTKGDGANEIEKAVNGYVGPNLGDLQQNYIRGVGAYVRKVQAYSAILSAKLGTFDLTAVTAYNVNSFADSSDLSYYYGPIFGVSGVAIPENSSTNKLSQEIRFSTPIGQRLEWLFGGFYTHERSEYDQHVLASDPSTGTNLGELGRYSGPTTFSEYAAFTDLTYHVTPRFDVQFGGRGSEITQTYSTMESGFGLPTPFVQPEVESKANAFTYLVTPQFKVSPDLMVYARLASGYRAGGPNLVSGAGVPSKYDPDKTQNYEIGAKGDFLEHALSFDASIYYIDWKNIQLSLFANGNGYVANGSRAKSQGIEFSVESRPLTGLTIAAWVVWDDAQLTQDLPPTSTVYGASGDRLPYISRFSGTVSVQQDFPLTDLMTGFVGGTVSYVGDRVAEFTPPPPAVPPRQDLPAYTKMDLRAGVKYDSWALNFFVNNVTDKRGLLSGGQPNFPPWAFVVLQPRIVGLFVARTF
jgi:iron complex outermembrane receptor protein